MNARFLSRLSRGFAVLAIAVVAGILAGVAHAAPLVDRDSMSTLGSGAFTFRNGEVDWYWGDGKISAHLGGTLRLDEANGSCARMRIEYFNDSATLGDPKYGGTVCAPDSDRHDYTVDLNPWGSPDIDLVKVSLQKQTASNGWSTVESAYFKPTIPSDKVFHSADGVDFGGDTWGIHSPIGSATLDWTQGEGMNLTPHVRGTLWLDDVAGLCARVTMTYYSESNGHYSVLRDQDHSGRACAPDNGFYSATIDMAPFTSDQIAAVDVLMQTQRPDGSWQDVIGDLWSGSAYVDDSAG